MNDGLPTRLTVGLLAGPHTGNEHEALRHTLEYMGINCVLAFIGRPLDIQHILAGKHPLFALADHLLLCVHGENGHIVLPELAPSRYKQDEIRGMLSPPALRQFAYLPRKWIINTGCGLGTAEWAQAFLQAGARLYIGASEEVEGNSSLMFVCRFYYELIQNRCSPEEAFERGSQMDTETRLFRYFTRRTGPAPHER
ncbi:MAG: delta-aminolevulinic acid dehydratase [Bacteroidetes bacterium]|nr:MAG: delta-aminolevulinic acid dehydratase [Bacteroidota bacterium]